MKTYKKYIIYPILIALGLTILITLATHVYNSIYNNDETVIKIGAILPLTGDAALAGQYTKKGIDLGVKEINERGGIMGNSLSVIYEDTKGDPKTGVNATMKLITQDKVSYIIDNSLSSIALAVAPLFKDKNCILMGTGVSSPEITNAGENIFRIWNSDYEEASAMTKFASESLKLKKILIVYSNDEYGLGLKNAFINNKYSGKLKIKEIGINVGSNLPSNLFKNVREYDGIYIISYSNFAIQLIRKIIENGFEGIFLGTSVMLDPNVQKEFGKMKNTLYYPTPDIQDSANSEYVNFEKSYKKEYGVSPVPLSDVGYDAVKLFYYAVNSGNADIYKSLKEYFSRGLAIQGSSGVILFDENGDVHKEILIKKLK